MKKKIYGLIALFLVLAVGVVYAGSGRESTKLPPQEVEIMYSSEDHAYQAKDINDVVRWKVLPDGTMATYDAGGVTVFNSIGGNYLLVNSDARAHLASVTPYTYLVDTVNYAGYTDTSIAGVSVWLPQGGSSTDGKIVRFINVGLTGTTDVFVVPAGGLTSGVTDCINGFGALSGAAGVTGNRSGGTERTSAVYDVADAHGESVTYVYVYAASGGTWYQISRD